ncbi:hypothetical protein AAVH_10703 [Aphelenchoides avenae]|nr:hypothetical protein AAVH_10703 [Aphelenchus avenae]
MFHVGFAFVALLVPTVLPCGLIGRRAGQPEDRLVHVHVVVYGKAFCAYVHADGKYGNVSLELGEGRASPHSYRALNSTKYEGRPEGVEFALAGDYSYDPQANCVVGKPRVSVQGLCGYIEIYDLKPVYKGDLGDKKQRLEVYHLADIHPIGPF